MKKYILSMTVASVLFATANATSLKEAVQQTLDANPDVLSEKFNKDAFKKYIDEEKSDYFPTLDFEAFADDVKTTYDRDNVADDPTKEDKDGWNVSLKFEQLLYDGGRTPSEVEEFEHRYYANKYRSNNRVDEIVRDTIDSYLDLVKHQELLNLSEINIKQHDDYLVTAREKEEISGEVLESYQVNSKKHFVIDRYLEQQQTQAQALSKYEKYTQNEINGNVCRPQIDESILPDTLEKAIEIAMVRNFKILEQVEKIKEQRENINQAFANNLPTLKFQYQATWDNDLEQAENGREDFQRARVLLTWNLFEGGRTKDATQKEELFLQEQQKILDEVTNTVVQEVKDSYYAYYNAKKRVENIAKFVEDNRNIKNVYVKQLQDGTRTFIDILNAESELYRSEMDKIEQQVGLYGLYYDLLQKLGVLSESILMSQDQTCSQFVPKKYKSPMEKTQPMINTDELNNPELLQELGEEAQNDAQIQQIINSVDTKAQEPLNETKNMLPNGKYTINVTTLEKFEDVDTFKKQYGLSNDENLKAYNMGMGTKIIYGGYESLQEATDAIALLNQKGMSHKVYVDYMEKHKKLLEKYKSIN